MTEAPDLRLAPRRLADALRASIIFLELEPGLRMTEDQVAARHGVSRSPVREALHLLETEGLLVRDGRRGVRISGISRRDLDEVYRCRIPLEGQAAADAAARCTPRQMSELSERLQALEEAFGQRDIRAYFVANVALSGAIHGAADNLTLRRLLESVGHQALRYRYLALRSVEGLIDVSVDGNRDLITLIRRRDTSGARQLTERLIEHSWRTIREHVAA